MVTYSPIVAFVLDVIEPVAVAFVPVVVAHAAFVPVADALAAAFELMNSLDYLTIVVVVVVDNDGALLREMTMILKHPE